MDTDKLGYPCHLDIRDFSELPSLKLVFFVHLYGRCVVADYNLHFTLARTRLALTVALALLSSSGLENLKYRTSSIAGSGFHDYRKDSTFFNAVPSTSIWDLVIPPIHWRHVFCPSDH